MVFVNPGLGILEVATEIEPPDESAGGWDCLEVGSSRVISATEWERRGRCCSGKINSLGRSDLRGGSGRRNAGWTEGSCRRKQEIEEENGGGRFARTRCGGPGRVRRRRRTEERAVSDQDEAVPITVPAPAPVPCACAAPVLDKDKDKGQLSLRCAACAKDGSASASARGGAQLP